MAILITGAAGFIGYHLAFSLCAEGAAVIGIDNLNAYYDPALKKARLKELSSFKSFRFIELDLADKDGLDGLFAREQFDAVVHLAAQAGVRHSIKEPLTYGHSNLMGHLNILEACRHNEVPHLVYASSSSVYGANRNTPFSETDMTDSPVSLYGATKKANELMSYSYSHLYQIPITGLRFFTVYGPWGRPDMAYYDFTRKILAGETIRVFNHGNLKRDFTYISDIIAGIRASLRTVPSAEGDGPAHRVYNLGNHQSVKLMDFIETLERAVGKKAVLEYVPMQQGDVFETYADISRAQSELGFTPHTSIAEGLPRFVEWYKTYHA